MSSRDAEIAVLEARLEWLREQPEVTYFCAVCRRTPEEIDYEPLTDVTVVVADGEEGYSNVTQLLCNEHLEEVAMKLEELGFKDHRHGSTSTLEDVLCPGFQNMEDCPTPTHYGNVTWGRNPPQGRDD